METGRQAGSKWQALAMGPRGTSCSACQRGEPLYVSAEMRETCIDNHTRTKIYLEADAAMNTYETAEGKRTSLNLVQRKDFQSEVIHSY